MSKRVSIKLPPGQAKKVADAVTLVRSQYGAVLGVWRELPVTQRQKVLAASPVLARLMEGVG